MDLTPRARAQAIAASRGGRHTLAVPLALRLAARIQERSLDDFFADPTQLANGLSDLLGAVGPDGVVVTDPEVLAEEVATVPAGSLATAPRTATALEATRRLKATHRESAVVVALLPGPASVTTLRGGDLRVGAEVVESLGKAFLTAGIDVLVFREDTDADLASVESPLRTVTNMARFHRALIYVAGPKSSLVDGPTTVPLDDPRPAEGLVLTERDLAATTDLTVLQDWVRTVTAKPGPG